VLFLAPLEQRTHGRAEARDDANAKNRSALTPKGRRELLVFFFFEVGKRVREQRERKKASRGLERRLKESAKTFVAPGL